MSYTAVPNHFIDHVMKYLTPSAVMVYLYICRKTIGWHKEYDTISLSQFVEETGLTKPTVMKALNHLISVGAVITSADTGRKQYKIADTLIIKKSCCEGQSELFADDGKKSLLASGKETLPKIGKSKKSLPVSGKETLPEPVKNLSTQKKGNKNNSTKSSRGQADARLTTWPFIVYRELTHLHVPHAFRDRVELLESETAWRSAITKWIGRGYRVNNIAGMLEWYEKELEDVRRTERQEMGRSASAVEAYIEANRKYLEPL